uniref:Ribokinase n=1 Tax=Strongyloides venezuelensis TaxID=75913 RepID=A0A0K0FA33_STRVS
MEGKNLTIIVFGSIVQDLISYAKKFPKGGESVRGSSFIMGSGGKGANQAVAAAKLGSVVKMIGAVGDDIFGEENIKNISKSGVDVQGIEKIKNQSTGTATIFVNEEGENCIVVTLSANYMVNEERADQSEEYVKNSGIVMIQNEIDENGNSKILKIAKKYNVKTLYNPAPGLPNINRDLLRYTDILVANENETEMLVGKSVTTDDDFMNAVKELIEHVNEAVILTRGKYSTIVGIKNDNYNIEIFTVPTISVKAIDTTGAGDCFCGSFAHAYITKGLSIKDSIIFASKVASISVQRQGTQSSYPLKNEINF